MDQLQDRLQSYSVWQVPNYVSDWGTAYPVHGCVNLLAPELFFLILAHPVYKM